MPRRMERRVALATYAGAPHLAPDDRLLVEAFAAHGVGAEGAVWSDPAVDWSAFDCVIIRSCWDYHLKIGAFHAWLDRLDGLRRPVWNPPSLVRWNADKRYLLDLAARGVPTVPTVVVAKGQPDDVARAITARGWTRFVVKPVVSASGYETYSLRAPLDARARATIARVTGLGSTLVQPFIDEVPRNGEFSFTFIDGAFSHATIKRATPGEFRVQAEHGGSATPARPSDSLVAAAARTLAGLPHVPLYARVDGVVRDGGEFLLMELELIEPNLYFEHGTHSAQRFVQAVLTRCAWR